jgi:hypothetical protein
MRNNMKAAVRLGNMCLDIGFIEVALASSNTTFRATALDTSTI